MNRQKQFVILIPIIAGRVLLAIKTQCAGLDPKVSLGAPPSLISSRNFGSFPVPKISLRTSNPAVSPLSERRRNLTDASGARPLLKEKDVGTAHYHNAFVPDNATWIALDQLDGLTIQAADTETLLAMKIAAEGLKETVDIARLLRRLNITNAADAVDLAYDKYGDHSIPLAAGRENYLIVVDDALDATATLQSETDE